MRRGKAVGMTSARANGVRGKRRQMRARTGGARPTHPAVIVGSLVVIAFGAFALQGVMAPLLLALLLVVSLSPVRSGLIARRVPVPLATTMLALALVSLLAGFGAAMFIALAEFSGLIDQYSAQIDSFAASVGIWLSSLGFSPAQSAAAETALSADDLLALIGSVIGGVLSLGGWAVLLVTALLLLAVDTALVPALAIQMRPVHPRLVSSLSDLAVNVRRYMVTTAALGAAQAVVNGSVLLILGVPGAFLGTVLAFLCSFIPNVGYFIAIIPPVIFGAISGGWPTVVAIVVIYSLVNTVIHSVIGPRIIGNAVALSPTLAFVSLLVWASILGAIGALLAIPLTLFVRAVMVDANPQSRRWRPVSGDYTQTRAIDRALRDERRRAKRPT